MMVFCADKLDPLRGYDSTKLIEICNKDIKEGFDLVVQQREDKHGNFRYCSSCDL